ncbi:MAG: hypothetical protein ACI4UU_00655 [Clostridia bacterium]
MKQIKKDTVCYYCYGCNKLEQETFEGVRNCKNFISAIENWQGKLREELKKK